MSQIILGSLLSFTWIVASLEIHFGVLEEPEAKLTNGIRTHDLQDLTLMVCYFNLHRQQVSKVQPFLALPSQVLLLVVQQETPAHGDKTDPNFQYGTTQAYVTLVILVSPKILNLTAWFGQLEVLC